VEVMMGIVEGGDGANGDGGNWGRRLTLTAVAARRGTGAYV